MAKHCCSATVLHSDNNHKQKATSCDLWLNTWRWSKFWQDRDDKRNQSLEVVWLCQVRMLIKENIFQYQLLRSEIPSGMCTKLCTVAASNNRDHARNLFYCCLLALHIWWRYSSRTSRSWWIIQSTQHHRRGCNTTLLV